MERTRVALVVFADVTGCGDVLDAANIVGYFLRDAVQFGDVEYPVPMRHGTPKVRFHGVMEAGMAAGNGYLWTEVTSKAFRMYEWQRDEPEKEQ